MPDRSDATLRHLSPTADSEAQSFVLQVTEGPDVGVSFAVEAGAPSPLLLGTSPSCELRLTDPAVSRRHASLMVEGRGLRLTDLASTNAVYLGDLRIHDVTLAGGETLRFGATTLQVKRLTSVHALSVGHRTSFGKLIGASPEMRRLYPLLERLAATQVPVIVEGETGTGKEVLAEAIHDEGPRKDGPFIVFDCTAVPANLLESALFGHEKGSFTGAVQSRAGVFEQAHGGTLLIDEIGDLDLSLQPKLLRAIQRSEVQRVGASKWTQVDVRVIAATRRDLDREVAAGRFRDDLFYRLNVARVELPPLRRRPADIAVLARHFWKSMGGDEKMLTEELLARFEDDPWPGNVRQLYNSVARHIALGDLALSQRVPGGVGTATEVGVGEESTILDGSPPVAGGIAPRTPLSVDPTSPDLIDEILALDLGLLPARERVVRAFERRYLQRTLDRHEGNVTRAAAAAGIARRYFHQLLKRDKEP